MYLATINTFTEYGDGSTPHRAALDAVTFVTIPVIASLSAASLLRTRN